MKSLMRFMAYFGYCILIGCLMVSANAYKAALKTEMIRDLEYKPMFFIIVLLLPIFIGLLAALPRFILKTQKPGKWTFDWIKFAAIGLPCFVAAGSTSILSTIVWTHFPILFNNSVLATAGGIVFGYVLLNSIEKKPCLQNH